MRIVLIKAPASAVHNQRASLILEQAIQHLYQYHPNHECIVLPGEEPAGRFSFFEKRRRQRTILQLNPDVLIYASPENLLPVNSIKTVVLVTHLNGNTEKNLLKKHASKLTAIITDVPALKNEIIQSLKIDERRVHLVQLTEGEIDTGAAINQSTRETFTADKEYFFYGEIITENKEWELVLQAFSQFKKWQQSGLQLVLVGDILIDYEYEFREKLNVYKYKHDVIYLKDLSAVEKNQLAAAAFAVMADAVTFEGRMNIINAFRAGIPVITHKSMIADELCGDTALYADFKNAGNLSQQMIALYKNEEAYIRLAEAGKMFSINLNSAQTLSQLDNALQQVVEQ